jgi:hypothetical protein
MTQQPRHIKSKAALSITHTRQLKHASVFAASEQKMNGSPPHSKTRQEHKQKTVTQPRKLTAQQICWGTTPFADGLALRQ